MLIYSRKSFIRFCTDGQVRQAYCLLHSGKRALPGVQAIKLFLVVILFAGNKLECLCLKIFLTVSKAPSWRCSHSVSNIRLGWKLLSGENAQAYYAGVLRSIYTSDFELRFRLPWRPEMNTNAFSGAVSSESTPKTHSEIGRVNAP